MACTKPRWRAHLACLGNFEQVRSQNAVLEGQERLERGSEQGFADPGYRTGRSVSVSSVISARDRYKHMNHLVGAILTCGGTGSRSADDLGSNNKRRECSG